MNFCIFRSLQGVFMKNSKEWLSVAEILELEADDLPKSDKGIVKKADRENWEKRQREGVKGKTFEYHVSSFPEAVQKALGFVRKQEQATTTLPAATDADELEMIPYYELYASAGYGSFNVAVYEPDDYIGLSKRWLTQRGFRINHLTFFQAEGDSMYPTISDGDALLVDLSEKQPKDGRIYILRHGEQMLVKRVQGIRNGIRLISDNKTFYDPVDLTFDDALDLEVIGRVVHIGHSLI